MTKDRFDVFLVEKNLFCFLKNKSDCYKKPVEYHYGISFIALIPINEGRVIFKNGMSG